MSGALKCAHDLLGDKDQARWVAMNIELNSRSQ